MTTAILASHHRKQYPAISPSAAQNSQQGRTVLITGGSSGIGFATARAFVAAGAARVIVTGRRDANLASAIEELEHSRPARLQTVLLGRVSDISSAEDNAALWAWLAQESIAVDVLILNAGMIVNCGVLSRGFEQTKRMYETNVIENLRIAHYFIRQGSKLNKTLLYISSAEAHLLPAPDHGSYAATKLAAANMFQNLATEYPAEEVKIINVHPGAVLTTAAKENGYTKDTLPWDSEAVPAGFLVWASTQQAIHLHGRFIHATWDVEELMKSEAQLRMDQGLFRTGIQGIKSIGMMEYVTNLANLAKTDA